jgi:hypothetical protein
VTDAQWSAWCAQPGTDAFGYPWSSWTRNRYCPDTGCTCIFCAPDGAATHTPPPEPQGEARKRAPAAKMTLPAVSGQMDFFA